MKAVRIVVLLLSTLAVVGYTANYVLQKEALLSDGDLVLFRLAPVDPRSLLQGDYMALDYVIARDVRPKEKLRRGFLVFTKDTNGVARYVRVQAEPIPISGDEQVISFRSRLSHDGSGFPGRAKIGSDSYFFEEGRASKFEAATFGGLRVDKAGNALLERLYDADYKPIE